MRSYAGIGYAGAKILSVTNTAFDDGNELWRSIDFDVRTENRYTWHPQGLRRCIRCREVKPLNDFASAGKGRKMSSCKLCENECLGRLRDEIKKDPQRYCATLISQLRHRAKTEGSSINITAEQLFAQWEKQSGRCFYTDTVLDLSLKNASGGSPHLDFPSVDKLIPFFGYVEGNFVWCKWSVNRAKNNLDKDAFVSMCKTIAERFS